MPYSGPASAYGVIGKTEAAYFKKINAEGGINGRKINFISYDDAYKPPKAVEQAANWLKATECCSFSILSVLRPTRDSKVYEREESSSAIRGKWCDKVERP